MRLRDEMNIRLVYLGVKPASFLNSDTAGMALHKFKEKDSLQRKPTTIHGIPIAYSRANLDRLLSAKTPEDRGRALGYPEDAVAAFEGELSTRRYMSALIDNYDKKRDFPVWLPYINHIPSFYDFENNEFSQSSIDKGLYYRNALLDYEANLVLMIDNNFFDCLKSKLINDNILEGNWGNNK